MSRKPSDAPWLDWINVALLVLAGIIVMTPTAWMILSSFKPSHEVTAYPPTLVFSPTGENYATLTRQTPFMSYAVNSLIVTAGSTILGLIFGAPAAFVASWTRITWPAVVALMARMAPGHAVPAAVVCDVSASGHDRQLLGVDPDACCDHPANRDLGLLPYFDANPAARSLKRRRFDGCSRRLPGVFRLERVCHSCPSGLELCPSNFCAFVFSWNFFFLFALVLSMRRPRPSSRAVFQLQNWRRLDQTGVGLMAAATIYRPGGHARDSWRIGRSEMVWG